MYTSKEQTELLLSSGIVPDSCDMVVFAGKSKTDPYKDWIAEPKINIIEKEANKKVKKISALEAKEWMPVWSDEALFDMLPTVINNPDADTEYELHVLKRTVKGRGLFMCVGYFDVATGKPWQAFMHQSLTHALCSAVVEFLCSDKYEIGNFSWE